MRKHLVKSAAIVGSTLLVLAACGSNKQEGGNAGGSCDTSKGTLTIGVVAPLSGNLSALGIGIKQSAELAVDEANKKCTVKGYKLAVSAQDDEANPAKGAQAATKLATDPNVVGVVGTLNSSVAQTVQPILRDKKIPQVSPANTNPSLTRGNDFLTAPKRQFDNYFRVCATDDLQGPYAANYLVEKAGKKKIAIVTDGKTYGAGLAAELSKQVAKKGGTIVGQETVGEKDTDFSGVIAKIKGLAPDAVYYGGEYPAAGPLSKQMASAGLNVPLMGGDGIYDGKFIELGGKEGDLATSVGAPVESLATAKAFVDAYKAKFGKEDYAAYGAFSYDAANAIIGALGATLSSGDWAESKREDMLTNVGKYSASGATGEIKFDQYGDSTNKVLTVYQVTSGKWKDVQTGEFTG
ncbi:branched-chain amino acid transport system substrate-binding protein [Lentzea atacamensis]|uniref:Branched-chain amino acid transport system substrate-binding protein n=2 Tax=Lentzea TaxID=165301 RepID=A0A316HPR5_9PSEU|nr:branched-chain amino acid ABC transporter substrate-binding protein [Lentzea atacamensis]PWK82071.1 branched-chain amino acid transport system substrate-binding protein [Lentzea atacamensis]RAS61220.1 branched-chain amino acid transport system substrate-binding protein [Lentzea atacamensis]